MCVKDPCVIADPDDFEKTWDKDKKKDDDVKEERTAADPGAPARMGRGVPTPAETGKKPRPPKGPGTKKPEPISDPAPDKPKPPTVKGPGTKKPAPKGGQGPATKKQPRYNPFKDGRTPTSASETTGP